MKKFLRLPLLLLPTAVLAFAAGIAVEKRAATGELESRIYRRADARESSGDWGSIRVYTPENTTSHGIASLLTAELEFLPGRQLQPPHRHAEEEFQYVIEGGGTWFLNGAETVIRPGDLMYAKPGDLHGISNTSEVPLRFLVIKWNSKAAGGPAPVAE